MNLPHPSTLKKWYANSGANGEPGVSMGGLSCLVNLVNEMNRSEEKFYCSLAFDEMDIRRHVQYADNRKEFLGFVTFGKDGSVMDVARQAIVFMVNGINRNVSFPVAHHFISSLDSDSKAVLIKNIIVEISNTGTELLNIAFDGLVTNFTTFKKLGASFVMNDFRPFILNPVNGMPIRIILDPCHMIKLTRNCLENEGTIYDGEGQKIQWLHFDRLESYRVKNQFVTHKLTKKHIQCYRNKMNVRLAVQTLSDSVANSLEYLMNEGVRGFDDCAGTIRYCRIMNRLFDILNTTYSGTLESDKKNINKMPLSIKNVEPFLDEVSKYIPTLRIRNKNILVNILESRKKTGFLGLLVNIHNLKMIFEDYVATKKMEYMATFHLGQDPLESFFGRIRSKCGSNDNPTAEQFKSAYRKTLVNREITSSALSNCQDRLNIFFVPSSKPKKNVEEVESSKSVKANSDSLCEWIANPLTPNDILVDVGKEATVVQRAADIEWKIRENFERFKCRACFNVLNENRKNVVNISSSHEFQSPCESTTFICKVAWKYLDIFIKRTQFEHEALIVTIINAIDFQTIFVDTDFELHSEHKHYFIQFIAEEFIRMQSIYIAKNLTLKEQSKLLRNKLNKTIHFMGQ